MYKHSNHSRRSYKGDDELIGWKPWTIRAPALILITIITLVLAAVIEHLSRRSQRNGGLALSDSADDISTLATFNYLYLPTIIAVLYSLFWAFIDLDTKRLQPFIELSRDGGASAHNSLLLDYPFEFVVWVPMKALRRRHWPVFLTGLIVVLIVLLITPLQGAIMHLGPVSRTSAVAYQQTQLPAVSKQAADMDIELLNTAYSTSWLGQPLPSFTTRSYALLPVSISEGVAPPASDTNITITTTKLSTSLSCWPAAISNEEGPFNNNQQEFDNGKGCLYREYYAQGTREDPFDIVYIGYYITASVDYFLEPFCPKTAENQFLLIWSKRIDTNSTSSQATADINASFCETSYSKQVVSVTVSAKDYQPYDESIEPIGPEQVLEGTEFNTTAFEYLLGTGEPMQSELKETTFMGLTEQYSRLANIGIHWPLTPLTGYALAGQDLNLDVYSDMSKLQAIFEDAHKLFFSLAVSRLASVSSPANSSGAGYVTFTQYGVIIDRPFAIAVEALLLLVAILAGILTWCCWSSPSKLQHDPDTINSIIDLIRYSSDVKSLFLGRDTQNHTLMARDLEKLHFMLCDVWRDGKITTVLRVRKLELRTTPTRRSDDIHIAFPSLDFVPVKPTAMKKKVGLLLVSLLLAVLGLLVYLKRCEISSKGLSLPTTNRVALQILENYLPLVFATSIEPFWVLLNRLLCITQPFRDLWRGHSPAARSIGARYTSLPPQMVVWRAVSSRHLLLAFLCVVSLLANILAVALGSLFNELPTPVDSAIAFKQTLSPILSSSIVDRLHDSDHNQVTTYKDHLRIVAANLSEGTSLPPWLTNDYYFLPVQPDTEPLPDAESFTVQTTGFGIVPSCTPLDVTRQSLFNFSTSDGTYNISLPGDDGLLPGNCSTYVGTTIQPGIAGNAAAEIYTVLVGTALNQSEICYHTQLLSWSRGMGINGSVPAGTVTSTYAMCQPRLTSALFDVTIDLDGHIFGANRLTDLQYNDTEPVRKLMYTSTAQLLMPPEPQWHSDNVTRDWVTYILKLMGSNVTDPHATPDLDALIPQVESVYKRAFAALLQQNTQVFDNLTEPLPTVSGTQRTTETKIFMPSVAFIASVSILVIDIVAVLFLYLRTRDFSLPREPNTVGSIIGYVAGSRMATVEWTDRVRGAEQETFSFGSYTGADGKPRLGIEVDPYVSQMSSKSRDRASLAKGAF